MSASRVSAAEYERVLRANRDTSPALPEAHKPSSPGDEPGALWCHACAACCRPGWPCICCRDRKVLDAAESLADDLLDMHAREACDLRHWPEASDLIAALGREVPT